MNEPVEIFRQGIIGYIEDLRKVNAKLAHKYATRQTLSSLPPQYISPSWTDIQYWINKTGHYAFLATPQSKEGE